MSKSSTTWTKSMRYFCCQSKFLQFQAFPQALSPRQVRLAFSTVVKLSPPTQVTMILTNLLQYAQSARTDLLPGAATGQPTDEQLTYFFAFIDCLPWIEGDSVEFWLDQFVFTTQRVQGQRREVLVKRMWECVSGDVGGEGGMRCVEWWVNGGGTRFMNPKL